MQGYMEQYGLDISENDWNLVIRRLINNPKLKIREISKSEFKMFIKVFRSDYESNREEAIKDILSGVSYKNSPGGQDHNMLIRNKADAETTFAADNNIYIKSNRSIRKLSHISGEPVYKNSDRSHYNNVHRSS